MLQQWAATVFASLTILFCLTPSAWAQGQPKAVPRSTILLPAPPSACDFVLDNLVANCGFESGDFTGWTFSGVDPSHNFVSANAVHTGNFGAVLGSTGGLGCFSQTLATTSGQLYALAFWLNTEQRPNNFQVFWNGVEVAGDLTNMPDFDYTSYGLLMLAGSGSDVLMFCAENDPSYFSWTMS